MSEIIWPMAFFQNAQSYVSSHHINFANGVMGDLLITYICAGGISPPTHAVFYVVQATRAFDPA